MNALARRIQFWYRDFEWGKQIAEDIINNMPEKCVVNKTTFHLNEAYEIYLLDGSKISIIPLKYTSRERADDVYIQAGISQKEFEDIAARCYSSNNLRVLTRYEDLFRFGKGFPISSYYYYI